MTSYLDNKKRLFLGRAEEQEQFRTVLGEILSPQKGEQLPFVFLLQGDCGMGKTSLAAQFKVIADNEPFKGKFRFLDIDWQREHGLTDNWNLGREKITPQAVFDTIHRVALRGELAKYFDHYITARKTLREAEKRAAEVLDSSGEHDNSDEGFELAGEVVGKAGKLVAPIGDSGEKLVTALAKRGFKWLADEKVRARVYRKLSTVLNRKQWEIYFDTEEQLARALGNGFKKITSDKGIFREKPMIVTLDVYEIVDHVDIWIRALMRASGQRVLWVICGRNNLSGSRPYGSGYFTGYEEEWSGRVQVFNGLKMEKEDIRKCFQAIVPLRELDDNAVEALSRATRGIPLAVDIAAEIWRSRASIEQITGNLNEATPHEEIVNRMTGRYLRHVVNNKEDEHALYALALAQGDEDLLRAMLRPKDGQSFDLAERLGILERSYASVHLNERRLHDAPGMFLRESLKKKRAEDWVKSLNERAEKNLRDRLQKYKNNVPLPRIEDQCENEEWANTAITLADYLFWLDETEAWRWFTPRFVESLVYNLELRDGLVKTAAGWEQWLSSNGKKRLQLFRTMNYEDFEAFGNMLDELDKLKEAGWLTGEGETERLAILDLVRGKLLRVRGNHKNSLTIFKKCTESKLPEGCEALRKALSESIIDVVSRLLWPDDGENTVQLKEIEEILQKVVQWLPDKKKAWHRLGVARLRGGNLKEAVEAFDRAINLDPDYVEPRIGRGNAFQSQGQHEEAIAAYLYAITLDPDYIGKSATLRNKLGDSYRSLGLYSKAIEAYRYAIEHDSKCAAAHHGLGKVHHVEGRYGEAIEAYEYAIELAPQLKYLHMSIAGCYRKLAMERKYDRHIQMASEAIAVETKYNRACFEAICGNAEKAATLLRAAWKEKQLDVEWAKRDPDFEGIRNNPKFATLLKKLERKYV